MRLGLRLGLGLGLGLALELELGSERGLGLGLEEAVHLAELRLAAQLVAIEAGVAVYAVEEDQRA